MQLQPLWKVMKKNNNGFQCIVYIILIEHQGSVRDVFKKFSLDSDFDQSKTASNGASLLGHRTLSINLRIRLSAWSWSPEPATLKFPDFNHVAELDKQRYHNFKRVSKGQRKWFRVFIKLLRTLSFYFSLNSFKSILGKGWVGLIIL